MRIKSRSGTEEEKLQAKRVLPVIERHHLLLVALMTWNASANEALPIFLDALVPGWIAIIMAVTIVLFVGEIIPAALLTGPNQLKFASSLIPVVYVVIAIFSPVAYPVSLLLDYILGADHGLTIYSKMELTTMMHIQHEEGMVNNTVLVMYCVICACKRDYFPDESFMNLLHYISVGKHGHDVESNLLNGPQSIHREEVAIIEGALKFRDMNVVDVMTPVHDVFMLQASRRLDFQVILWYL